MASDEADDEPTIELLQIFKPMIRFTARLERGTVDLARPRTEIAHLKTQIDSSMEGIDLTAILSGVGELLRALTPEEITEALSEMPPRPQRRRCDMLNEYMDLVERDAPFALGIVYGGSKLMGLDFLSKSLDAVGKLRKAARGSGETRIEALRIAAGFVLESLYKELVTVLYEIECVRLDRRITAGLAFGNLVETVAHSTRDLLPGFVDRHAARMRNAAYHDRWLERDVGSNVIDLDDTEATLRGLTPTQIYQRLRDYYRDVHDLAHCILWRMSSSMMALCRRPPIPHALAAGFARQPVDPAIADDVRALFERTIGGAITRLQALDWSPRAQPPTPATP